MALTPEELRQRIPNWSLDSDGHLLQYMISIAKNLEEKCTKTSDNLNNLMLQVNQTELKLSNATNQFSAVEQVKFVENRVEEDDESFYGLRRRRQQQQQQAESKEAAKHNLDSERSFDDLVQLAVDRSIEGMYKSFEKVTLELTDSDTSEGEDTSDGTRLIDAGSSTGKASIMRAVPRHAFIDRPLPHVIGSKEWQNKWHVGLIDSDDESNSDRKEEYSESSSDTDDGGMFPSQPNSKNHTPSESESSIWGTEVGRKRAPSMDPSITGDDGSSVYSYGSSSKPRTIAAAALPVRVAAPIGASLKLPGLFPEEPPEEIDGGKRRNDKGLFDESPEEEESMGEPMPKPIPRQNAPAPDTNTPFFKGTVHQPGRKLVNLFDDEPPAPIEAGGRMPEAKKAINLFIESDDEDEQTNDNARNNNLHDDTVARTHPISSNVRHSVPPTTNPRTMNKLVDELNNNFRKQNSHPEPQAAVGVSYPVRPVVSNLFDNEPPVDEFDQLFRASRHAEVKPAPRNAVPQPASRTVEKKTVNLFAEDDDDDDGIVVGSNERQPEPDRSPFLSPNHSIALPKQPERRVVDSKKKSIFDESDSDANNDDGDSGLFVGLKRSEASLPNPPMVPRDTVVKISQPPKPIKSIFSDSSEEEDDDDALFGHSSNVVKNKLDALKRNGRNSMPSAAPVTPVISQPSGTTFPRADRNGNDNHRSADKGKPSIFDEDSDHDPDGTLFAEGQLETMPKSSSAVPVPQNKESAKVSLFDDEPLIDSSTSLSGSRLMKSNVQNVPSKPSTESVAVDRDPLNAITNTKDTVTSVNVASALVPDVPAASIRSMIMKKSIFNTDSESEEDDSIFSSSARFAPAASIGTNGQRMNTGTEEYDVEDAQLRSGSSEPMELPREHERNSGEVKSESMRQPVPSDESHEVEQTAVVKKKSELTIITNSNGSNTQSTTITSGEDQNYRGKEIPQEKAVEVPPAAGQASIFDDSSSETEADVGLNALVHEIKSTGFGTGRIGLDREVENPSCDSNSVSVDVVAGADTDKFLEEQTDQLDKISYEKDSLKVSVEDMKTDRGVVEIEESNDAIKLPPSYSRVDDVETRVDHELNRSIPAEVDASPEVPAFGMIANDIDYFLRTNESELPESSREVSPPAVKSEPKSALNFSPIGLFDDVPPPDDDDVDDAYAHEQRKQFQSVDASSSLPSADDAPAYTTETQSLDFIPNGSGNGNGRTRYLFDDEPPPDEADNSSSSFGEPYPFRGKDIKVSLFEDRQRHLEAPVSLPPMTQDTTKTKPRPKVNKLNAKLAINVAALLPGARRPAVASAAAAPTIAEVAPEISFDQTTASSNQPPVSSTDRTNGNKLTSLNKGRARIPTKRKPPSRQTLRAAAVPSDVSQKEVDSVEADDRIVVGSEQKVLHIEGDQTKPTVAPEFPFVVEADLEKRRNISNLDPLVDRLSASVRNPSVRVPTRPNEKEEKVASTGVEKSVSRKPNPSKPTSIFGDSSDSNDESNGSHMFISKHPGRAPAKPLVKNNTRSIFGSDEDDDDGTDDIFGRKKFTITNHLKSAKPMDPTGVRTNSSAAGLPTASVKPPPSKGSTSIFGDDDIGSDDSDDLFGGKTKGTSKPPASKPTVRAVATTTTKAASSTRTVNDPLADLLDS